jgi:linoleoyl-CoA desaturase
MEKLQFGKDNGTAFYHVLSTRVKQMLKQKGESRYANRLMIFKTALYFSFVFVFYALLYTSASLFSFYLFYLLTGVGVLLLAFNVSHDAAHDVLFRNKKVNNFLFAWSFNLQGNNAYVWKRFHVESHHLYTNVHGSDIDVLMNPLFRMTKNQPLKWYHRYQYLYGPFLYLFYSLNWTLVRETLMIFGYSTRTIHFKIPRTEIIKLALLKVGYIGYMIVLPILLLPFAWWQVVLAFLLNHFIVSIIFTAVLGVSHLSDMVEHPEADESNKLEESWALLQMKTSVDYNVDSRFLNWVLGGFNAHTLHHLFPNVCHIHYLDMVKILKDTSKEFGIQYNETNYWNALRSHFRFLKKMGHAVYH